jgi:alanine dehydrogenase
MYKEPGEKRDFLPEFVASLQKMGAQVYLEYGYGGGMGLTDQDYTRLSPGVELVPHIDAYKQKYVLVLRCPDEHELRYMSPGSCLISMLHYPTRPWRVNLLRSLGLVAVSLDSLKDDSGRRLVENLRAVAWNGIEAAFDVLAKTYPGNAFRSPHRPPLQLTLLGAGAVGIHVVQAALQYGDAALRQDMVSAGVQGVMVNVVDYDTTRNEAFMRDLLHRTDVLVDATQRLDPSIPVIPNDWVAWLPEHSVLLDLSVDPYKCDEAPQHVKGIEGIPQGNLDQYIFSPQDPAFEEIPVCISTTNRRWSVSCYSWPGVHPAECMEVYGKQIHPIMRAMIEKGGIQNISPSGTFFERAISRALLSRWLQPDQIAPHKKTHIRTMDGN